jgi:hypothetical protein
LNELLWGVLDVHGGLDRWNSFERVDATVITDGALWGMKGFTRDQRPCRATVWLHQERCTMGPSGNSDLHSDFAPDRIAILKGDGVVIAERDNPRASFAAHVKLTRWDPLQLVYFDGYALWTYLSTPFLLAREEVEVVEIDPWTQGGETWRVLRAQFPDAIATHSAVQEFFFGEDFLLRRHDYQIDVAGGFDATHLVYDYVDVEGVRLPTRCRAYARGPGRCVHHDPLMVSVEISNIRFT